MDSKRIKINKRIRFLVLNYRSRRDANGNVYWRTKVVSTKTANNLVIVSGGEENVRVTMYRMFGLSWPEVYSIVIILGIRDFGEMSETYWKKAIHEHELTKEMILDLEME